MRPRANTLRECPIGVVKPPRQAPNEMPIIKHLPRLDEPAFAPISPRRGRAKLMLRATAPVSVMIAEHSVVTPMIAKTSFLESAPAHMMNRFVSLMPRVLFCISAVMQNTPSTNHVVGAMKPDIASGKDGMTPSTTKASTPSMPAAPVAMVPHSHITTVPSKTPNDIVAS